jgi:hypothetical protein
MKKNLFITFISIAGLTMLFFVIFKNTPATLESSGLLPKFSIDDIVTRAELIVIGEVQNTLPSRWNGPNGRNDPKNASSEEIARAGGLFTDSLISIRQILKGDIAGSVVRVRSFTGETDKIRLINESEPSYVVKKVYLLFLVKDFGATTKVDHGDYIAVGAIQGAYEIVDGKAISRTDEWDIDELIAYVQNKLAEADATATPTDAPVEPLATKSPIATLENVVEETVTPAP